MGLAVRWSLGCWLLTGLCVSTWTGWRLFDSEDCDLQLGRWCGLLQGCCALFRQSTVTDVMDTSGHSSPIWVYRANAHKMRASHDEDRSKPKDMVFTRRGGPGLIPFTGRIWSAGS